MLQRPRRELHAVWRVLVGWTVVVGSSVVPSSKNMQAQHNTVPVAVRRVANCYTPFTYLLTYSLPYFMCSNNVLIKISNYLVLSFKKLITKDTIIIIEVYLQNTKILTLSVPGMDKP